MKHTINIEEVSQVKEIELAGSYGKGEHKSLAARIHFHARIVDFIVYNKGLKVVECDYIEEAIEVYNNI